MSLRETLAALYGLDAAAARSLAARMAYASFVSLERGYLFMETPKAACSTIKWALATLSGAPPTPRQVRRQSVRKMCVHVRDVHPVPSLNQLDAAAARRALTGPDVLRFVVTRNPYARLASAYNDKIRNGEPGYRALWGRIAAAAGDAQDGACPGFAAFLRWLADGDGDGRGDAHWTSVCALNRPDLIDYHVVARTETLAADLAPVFARIAPESDAAALLAASRVNENLPADWRRMYDRDTAALAARLHAADFERFGYDPDDWRPRGGAGDDPARIEEAAVAAIRDRNEVIGDLLDEIERLRAECAAHAAGGLGGRFRRLLGQARG